MDKSRRGLFGLPLALAMKHPIAQAAQRRNESRDVLLDRIGARRELETRPFDDGALRSRRGVR